MKELYLLRHAKSSWDDSSLDDFDRPLNERGKKAAPIMGRVMREKNLKPDLILCSPSKRTKQTAKHVINASKLKSEITYDERIYEASTADLIELLKAQDAKLESILLIGHNPGIESLLTNLTGANETFPTAALAKIVLEIEKWKGIKDGAGSMDWILRPKELV
jgi:phosphohistidine phosphatase